MTTDDVFLSFLPLAHILDRMIEEYFFHKGASIGYYHRVREPTALASLIMQVIIP
jgi:long-subunit acyl-CoA synthetase (AMP-forming)